MSSLPYPKILLLALNMQAIFGVCCPWRIIIFTRNWKSAGLLEIPFDYWQASPKFSDSSKLISTYDNLLDAAGPSGEIPGLCLLDPDRSSEILPREMGRSREAVRALRCTPEASIRCIDYGPMCCWWMENHKRWLTFRYREVGGMVVMKRGTCKWPLMKRARHPRGLQFVMNLERNALLPSSHLFHLGQSDAGTPSVNGFRANDVCLRIGSPEMNSHKR